MRKKRDIALAAMVVVGLTTVLLSFALKGKSPSPAEEILKGDHQLQKIDDGNGSGYLIFSPDPERDNDAVVDFSWLTNDGTYARSSLPFWKIHPRIDEEAKMPTVKFSWARYDGVGTPEVQELMDQYVLYAVITTRGRDWHLNGQSPPDGK